MNFKFNLKQLFACAAILGFTMLFTSAHAQLKVGDNVSTINTASLLELESKTKGFLPPRMTTAERGAITDAPTGLLIYNTTLNCYEQNSGGSTDATEVWNCLSVEDASACSVCTAATEPANPTQGQQYLNTTDECLYTYNGANWIKDCYAAPATVGSLTNCASPDTTGRLDLDVVASGVSISLDYTGGNAAEYTGASFASSGVTGLTASLSSGTLALGSGTASFTISGTPTTAGTASFAVEIGGQSCTVSLTVSDATGGPLMVGTGDGASIANTAPSCVTILALNPTAPSGLYFIDVDGTGPLEAFKGYCDMTTDGGGWLLISKAKYTLVGPAKIEMTGDASLYNVAIDPWSGGVMSNDYVDQGDFTIPISPLLYPKGFNGDALHSPTDDLATYAPTELYAMMDRGLVEAYRANGIYSAAGGGTGTTDGAARLGSVIRQQNGPVTPYGAATNYMQTAKRFNPIQHKCATPTSTCGGTDFSGCAAELITTSYQVYTAATHTASTANTNGWPVTCANYAVGTNAIAVLPAGWMTGSSNASRNQAMFYDLSFTNSATSGPSTISGVCSNGGWCPLTTVWIK
jgi:hypothetical protein